MTHGNETHSHAKRGQVSKTYKSWNGMIQRCTNPDYAYAHDYSARGITVCERWRSFENFLSDMGERPEGMTLERKDNDLGYSRENCIWATRAQQNRNRRNSRLLTFNGKTQCVAEWERELGFKQSTVYARLRAGWDAERALSTPLNPSSIGKGNNLEQAI